ncbi:MAG: glycosyltransferase [Thiohalomonadaceae bacterium]
MNTVIFSHAHPMLSKGGGELAAYYLWQGIDQQPDHHGWFIGRAGREVLHRFSVLAAVGERNYLIAGDAGIPELTTTIPLGPDSDLAQLLREIRPDVVHFHHYVHLGIELIGLVRNICPRAKIVLTLHEYIAICMNHGQMVKTDGSLCHRYSPRECNRCFPHVKPEDVFLRERYIKAFFDQVDAFIAPSEFLKARYVAWGLEPARIEVIDNGLPEGPRLPPRPMRDGESRGRFAYFGQIHPFKGLDIILEAFLRLSVNVRKRVSLDVFGSGLETQAADFRERVGNLLDACKGTVRMHGPYEPEEMGRLLVDVDWMVMGSVWWENSPLVIQEAYKYGRPIICPDIGGMAEKVQAGVGGLHYRARDSMALAGVITRIVAEPGLFASLQESLPGHAAIGDITRRHLELYTQLRGSHVSG